MRGGSTLRSPSVRAVRSNQPRRQRVAACVFATPGQVACERLEGRQLLSVAVNGDVTLDESPGLQTTGVAVPNVEDFNDDDAAVGSLPTSFSSRLFGSPTAGLGLSSAFATQVGVARSAEDYITVTGVVGTIVSLGFSQANGSALPVYTGAATGGVASGLTAISGGAISFFADASLGSRMVLGVDTTNQVAVAMFLEPNATLTSATVWTVQFEPMSNPVATDFDDPVTASGLGVAAGISTDFDFDTLPSGQNLFGLIGDPGTGLVIIGKNPDLAADGTYTNASNTINTSKGGGGTTIGVNNQMFDPNDGAYFTFVEDPDPDVLGVELDAGEADQAANITYSDTLEVDNGFLQVVQSQGSAGRSMRLSAFDLADAPQGVAFVNAIEAAKPAVNLTEVRRNGVVVFSGSAASVVVSNINPGDTVSWKTAAGHDTVLVEGVTGKFDVGGFGTTQASTEPAPLTGVRFEDDGPGVEAIVTVPPPVTVDETTLTTDASTQVDPASVIPQFGTDGGATNITFSLQASGQDTGLKHTATGLNIFLLKVGDQVLGKAGTDAAAAASGPTVFALSISSAGLVTLDQQQAIVHPNPASHDESVSLLVANLIQVSGTVTDNDNDAVTRSALDTATLIFKDDGPSITADPAGAPTLTVDESTLTADDTKNFAGNFTPAFGADGPGATPRSYALETPGGASGLVDTATNQSVVLSLAAGVVEGRTATSGALVFTVSVDQSGNVTLDQSRAVKHGNPNDPDEATGLTGTNLVVLTGRAHDGDADQASADLDLTPLLVFKDDGPGIGPIANSVVDFAAGSSATKTLNGVIGADPNGAPYTVDSFTTTLTVNGVEVQGVTSGNNTVVTYYADTSGNGIFGDTGDTAFYKLELNQTANSGAGAYTFTVLADPPPAEVEFDFDDLPSGQNLFGTIGVPGTGLVIIGENPDLAADGTYTNASNTINTSKGGGATTIGVNNQMFDAGEGAFFTFVKDPDPTVLGTALDATEADQAANIKYGTPLEVDNGFLQVVQRQGGGQLRMRLSAFNLADAPQGVSFVNAIEADKPPVNITEVKINGVVVFTGNQASVELNINAGDLVSWKTAGLHDVVLVEGVAGKFDIGGFGTTQGAPTPDQKLDFVVRATDGDGDFDMEGFSIGIDGTGPNDNGQVDGVAVSSLFSDLLIEDALGALLE